MAVLHLLHININGLRANKTELESYLREVNADVLLINETKLKDKPTPRISGFRVAAVRNREAVKIGGGGVAIYVKKDMKFVNISPDIDDMVAIEIRFNGSPLAIISYYRPPYDSIDLNTPILESFLTKYEQCIIAGDLNAKHQYYGCTRTNTPGEVLFDFVERNELVVANDPEQMTRHVVSQGYQELLDYFIHTRRISRFVTDSYVGEDVSSDHLPVHLKLQLHQPLSTFQEKEVRALDKCNWEMFADIINDNIHESPDETLLSATAIDNRCEEIRHTITTAIDSACPKRTVKVGAFSLSKETLKLIREKRKIRRLSQKREDPVLKTLYNNLNLQVKKAISEEKNREWMKATSSLNDLNGCHLWKKFKCLTGVSSTARPVVSLKDSSGQMTSSSRETANEFARHLAAVHTTHEGPEFDKSFRAATERSIMRNHSVYTPSLDIKPETGDDDPLVAKFTATEIHTNLVKCKTRSAAGEDGISYGMLKHLPAKMFSILAQLYTICLVVGYFPTCWKSAVGVMLPKPDKDKKVASNYRPISLLSTIGKLFERAVATRLQLHLENTGFFNQWQRAYRRKKEAWEHVYRLGEEIRLAKGKKWTTTAVSLDVEKAFDSVWHDGIRYKLSALHLPVKLVRMLSSFLTDRTIRVRVEDELSDIVKLQAGTPQGSVLSPLLFTIYVNDLPVHPANNIRAGQFADDLSLWTSAKKKRVNFLRLQRALNDVELWCSIWHIKINVNKTQLVSYKHEKKKTKKTWELKLFGQTIKEQKHMKLLGVLFDQRLSYGPHCKEKARQASQRVNLLRTISGQTWGANTKTLMTFYKQYIRPILETGSVCTADAKKSHIKTLQLVQNSALRTALRTGRRTSIKTLHTLGRIDLLATRLKNLQSKAINRFGDSHLMKSMTVQRVIMS
jgi:exonuclease III